MLKVAVFLIFWFFYIFASISGQNNNGEVFSWNKIQFLNPPREPNFKIKGQNYYIPENNIPTGITVYNNRLFISIARRDYGIPSTLNYVDLRGGRDQSKSPLLKSYPNYQTNELHSDFKEDSNRIISVYRTRVDDCNRLWFVDTGIVEINGSQNVIQPPSIWIIDLRNDKLIRRFELPDSLEANEIGLQSITVDIDRARCDDAFAYIPNSKSNQVIVYSFKENNTWVFDDATLKSNDIHSKLTIQNQEYVMKDGVYSIALGPRNARERSRKIYYHPLASNFEYSTESKILRNKNLSERTDHEHDFQYVGDRGNNTQSGMHDYDQRTKVLFFTDLQNNAIGCWNTGRPLIPTNVASVARNDSSMVYLSDMKVDRTGNLWYLSNQQPIFERTPLDSKNINFYVFKKTTRSLIDGTICQTGTTGTVTGNSEKADDVLKNDEEFEQGTDEWKPDSVEKSLDNLKEEKYEENEDKNLNLQE